MFFAQAVTMAERVALLAEGVDRNSLGNPCSSPHRKVALLAEGVDRNDVAVFHAPVSRQSPSSRRAWIEILLISSLATGQMVALLAEGVDRNMCLPLIRCSPPVALLAEGVDRNQIVYLLPLPLGLVALLAEGVDRNRFTAIPLTEPAVALLAEGVDRNSPAAPGSYAYVGRPPRGGRG